MSRALRVLIIEDWDGAREALRLLLERLSCRVDTAADGTQGMRLALDGDYDLLICDLNLPGKDGLEVGRALARITPRPYICAYTAYSLPEDRERTRGAGFDAHIGKGTATEIGELKDLVVQLQARL